MNLDLIISPPPLKEIRISIMFIVHYLEDKIQYSNIMSLSINQIPHLTIRAIYLRDLYRGIEIQENKVAYTLSPS